MCPKHGPLHPIPNRPVLTRARASLPLVLYIDRFLGGVFSKRRIPKRTQFGPVEGPLVRQTELKDCYIHLKVRVCEERRDQLGLKLRFSWVWSMNWSMTSLEMFLPALNITQKYPDCFGLKSTLLFGETQSSWWIFWHYGVKMDRTQNVECCESLSCGLKQHLDTKIAAPSEDTWQPLLCIML